eukprot:g6172.t1
MTGICLQAAPMMKGFYLGLVITSADLLNRILFHDWVMAIFPFRITDKLTIHPPLMVPAFGLLNNWLSEQIFDNGPGGLFALCCGQVVLFLFWRCGQDCQCYFSTGCPWPYLQLTFPYFCSIWFFEFFNSLVCPLQLQDLLCDSGCLFVCSAYVIVISYHLVTSDPETAADLRSAYRSILSLPPHAPWARSESCWGRLEDHVTDMAVDFAIALVAGMPNTGDLRTTALLLGQAMTGMKEVPSSPIARTALRHAVVALAAQREPKGDHEQLLSAGLRYSITPWASLIARRAAESLQPATREKRWSRQAEGGDLAAKVNSEVAASSSGAAQAADIVERSAAAHLARKRNDLTPRRSRSRCFRP